KWTTYRKMALDTVNKAIEIGALPSKPCVTASLKIHGYAAPQTADHLTIYGSDLDGIQNLAFNVPELGQLLHKRVPNIAAEVVWAAQNEMARTVEDVLARRMRILFLDARAAMDVAPKVARLLANELGHGEEWQDKQVKDFIALAS